MIGYKHRPDECALIERGEFRTRDRTCKYGIYEEVHHASRWRPRNIFRRLLGKNQLHFHRMKVVINVPYSDDSGRREVVVYDEDGSTTTDEMLKMAEEEVMRLIDEGRVADRTCR